jgi:DNA-binding response OmpR family regulator
MHILMVEDDLDLGRALLQGLKTEGISCEWVRRAADARRFIENAALDCVLLDLSLPDGTGHDLLCQWRQAGMLLPIIIITARSPSRSAWPGWTVGRMIFWSSPSRHQNLLRASVP